MEIALLEAKKAFEKGEVPVGAVLVKEGKILSQGHNGTEEACSQTAHAELVVLKKICDKEVIGATLYVTLEPCPMCLGALIEAQIGAIVFGATEPRWGSLGGVVDLKEFSAIHVVPGICQEACRQLMKDFFKLQRNR